jgi:hypothetical protein
MSFKTILVHIAQGDAGAARADAAARWPRRRARG